MKHTQVTNAERFVEHYRLVAICAIAYSACKHTQPVVAFNCDPAPESKSPRWSPITAEYLADIEIAIRRALQYKTEDDRTQLMDAWFRFLEDDTNLDAIQKRLIGMLGPNFHHRGLHPARYFRPRVRRIYFEFDDLDDKVAEIAEMFFSPEGIATGNARELLMCDKVIRTTISACLSQGEWRNEV